MYGECECVCMDAETQQSSTCRSGRVTGKSDSGTGTTPHPEGRDSCITTHRIQLRERNEDRPRDRSNKHQTITIHNTQPPPQDQPPNRCCSALLGWECPRSAALTPTLMGRRVIVMACVEMMGTRSGTTRDTRGRVWRRSDE